MDLRISFKFRSPLVMMLALSTATLASHAQITVANAVATVDQNMRNYGLISFGSATFTNYGDTWGPLAVQNNLSLSSGSIAQKPNLYGNTGAPTLYVGGQLSMTGTVMLEGGYASTPNLNGSWSWDGVQRRLTGSSGTLSTINSSNPLAAVDPRTNPTPTNWNWTQMKTDFEQAAAVLAAATPTGTIGLSGQTLTFNSTLTSGVAVFELDMNRFNGTLFDLNGNGQWDQNNERVSQVVANVPTNVTFVVNVVNATDKTIFDGINFNAGTNNSQLLWNITPDSNPALADSVSLGGGARFYGSILAPNINLSNSGSVAPEGQIVSFNYNHNGAELHYSPFSPTVSFTPVPEPATWALGGAAAAGLAIVLQVRQRRRAHRVVRA